VGVELIGQAVGWTLRFDRLAEAAVGSGLQTGEAAFDFANAGGVFVQLGFVGVGDFAADVALLAGDVIEHAGLGAAAFALEQAVKCE
jgi:hypothetical protein